MLISPETHRAEDVVRLLALEPLPHEGGWYRRTLAADDDPGEGQPRAWSAIYALFTPEGFSALHQLTTDEVWCFHVGDALESLRLYPDGRGEIVALGLDPVAGHRPQDVVRGGVWQGTRLIAGGRWALVTCVVAPEFRWEDFRLAERQEFVRRYPDWKGEIEALTRD